MSHEEIAGLLIGISVLVAFFLVFWSAERAARRNPESWAAGILSPDPPLDGPPKVKPVPSPEGLWSETSPAYRLLVMAAARALRDVEGQALTVEDLRDALLDDGVRIDPALRTIARALSGVPGVLREAGGGFYLPVEEVQWTGLRAEALLVHRLAWSYIDKDQIDDKASFLEAVLRFSSKVAHPLMKVEIPAPSSSWERDPTDPRGDIKAALADLSQAADIARDSKRLSAAPIDLRPRLIVRRAGDKVIDLHHPEEEERAPCAPEGFTTEAVPERGQTCATCHVVILEGAGEDPDIPEDERPLYEIDADRWHHARCVPSWHPEVEECERCRAERLAGTPRSTTGPEIIGGAIYRLPSRSGGIGTVVQIYPGAGRDAHGRLYCCSTDPNRHRVYHDEEALLMLLDEKPTESRAMWAWWDRLLRGEVPLAPTTSNDRNPAPKETP